VGQKAFLWNPKQGAEKTGKDPDRRFFIINIQQKTSIKRTRKNKKVKEVFKGGRGHADGEKKRVRIFGKKQSWRGRGKKKGWAKIDNAAYKIFEKAFVKTGGKKEGIDTPAARRRERQDSSSGRRLKPKEGGKKKIITGRSDGVQKIIC